MKIAPEKRKIKELNLTRAARKLLFQQQLRNRAATFNMNTLGDEKLDAKFGIGNPTWGNK
jgi:hypothetical protein